MYSTITQRNGDSLQTFHVPFCPLLFYACIVVCISHFHQSGIMGSSNNKTNLEQASRTSDMHRKTTRVLHTIRLYHFVLHCLRKLHNRSGNQESCILQSTSQEIRRSSSHRCYMPTSSPSAVKKAAF